MMDKKNFLVLSLRLIGLLTMIVGLFLGNYINNTTNSSFILNEYRQIISIMVGVSGVAIGIGILGKAKQIKVLQKIYIHTSNQDLKCTKSSNKPSLEQSTNSSRS